MPKILDRVISQLEAKGHSKSAAEAIGRASLQKAGVLKRGTDELTAYGKQRQSMTPAQRAKSRASKYGQGRHAPHEYAYNEKTNRARLRNG